MALPKAGVELVAEGLNTFLSGMGKVGGAVEGVGTASEGAAKAVEAFNKTVERAAKIDTLTSKLKEQQSALGILQQELAKTVTKYGEGSIQAQKKQLAIDKLTNAINRTEAQIKTETDALEKEKVALDKAEPAVDKLGDTTEKTGKQTQDAGKQFDVFSEIVTGALRKIGEMAIDALADAGRAVGSFIKDSIGLAGDFQQGMLEFQAVAGRDVDTKGLEKFHDLFLQLGKELPVSTSDVQKAAIELAKGGIDPATIAAGGLESSIKFAAAAMQGDLVGAAGISAKIVGGWADVTATAAEKAVLLAHSQDILTKAANASTVDVNDLSLGLFNMQGNAKLAGIGLDESLTALALLAPNFSSASTAGTSLNAMIARLQPSTIPATDAMKALGLYTAETGSVFYDANGKFVGWAKTAQLLQDATKGLTDAQKQSLFQTIFGMDAMGAAAELTRQGAAGYEKMTAALMAANGVQENASLKQQGFNTALDNAKGSIEALQITLGEKLLPVLTDLLNNTIAPAINAFTDWSGAILGAEDPILALAQSLDALAPGLGSIVGYFATIITDGDALNDFLVTTPPLFHAVADAVQVLVSFLGDHLQPILIGVGVAIASVVVPAVLSAVGAFVAAAAPIVALVAAVALLAEAWNRDFMGIRTSITQWWEKTLQPALKQAQEWLAEKLPPAINALSKYWTDTLQPAVEKVGNFLTGTVFPILADLIDIYIKVAAVEIAALAAVWNNVLWPALKAVGSFISGVIIPIWNALFNVAFAIAKKEVEILSGLWQKVLWPALQKVSDYLSNTVGPTFQRIGDWLSSTFGPILEKVTAWLNKVTGGFTGVGNAVQGVITWLNNFANSISNLKLPSWLTPGSPTPLETGLLGIGKALQTTVAPGLDIMGQGLRDIGAAFGETDLVNQLQALGEDAMAGFGMGIKDGVRSVIRIIDSTATTVVGAFNDAFGAHSPATTTIPTGQSVTQGLMAGMESMIPALITLIDQTASSMISALRKNRQEMSAQLSEAADALIEQARDLAMDINSAIADGFGATASIDRQLAKNLDKFKDVLPEYQGFTQGALKQAEQQARMFTDPVQGAKFFKMRSDQILEYAKLQKELAEAETQADKDRIANQMTLINAAQNAEISEFNAAQLAQQSPIQAIADAFQQLLNNKDIALPGILDNAIIAQLSSLISKLQTPPENIWANPPASAQQIYGNNTTSYSSQSVYNMPIYTNQSPAALQQSLAIAQAVMP